VITYSAQMTGLRQLPLLLCSNIPRAQPQAALRSPCSERDASRWPKNSHRDPRFVRYRTQKTVAAVWELSFILKIELPCFARGTGHAAHHRRF
jgi:hypothetical protein